MTEKNNAIDVIVNAIRAIPDCSKSAPSADDDYIFHPDLEAVLGLILHNDELGPIDWSTLSEDLTSDNWHQPECLSGKSTNDLRAMMDQHLRNERFSRGHIQNLAATGYLDLWANALESSKV